jgi:RNA polymerase sigma-70 factor (ECF subfamily)
LADLASFPRHWGPPRPLALKILRVYRLARRVVSFRLINDLDLSFGQLELLRSLCVVGWDVDSGDNMIFAFTQTRSISASVQRAFVGCASTDEVLIERIAQRDQLAMRTLFARHQTRVYRFVLRLVRNEATAEDVLSDVFLDVWRHASQFSGRAAVSTWLLAIARFKAISTMRRRTDEQLDAGLADTLPDPGDDPEAALEHKDSAEILRKGLAQLSPAHAEVIDLVYYHGKSVKEVAAIVGLSEATVKTRMFYARKNLVELVQDGAR